jgi:hypothetical protein
MLIWSEDCGVLLRAHVKSGMAARMLAPLGGQAIGQSVAYQTIWWGSTPL